VKTKIISTVAGLALVALAMVSAGCRSTEPAADQKFKAWQVEMFRQEARSHQNVVLVCIYEDHLQRMPLPHKHRLDSKATVVRCYKGTWQVGEPIAFYQEWESVPQDWTPNVGHLVYLFFNKQSQEPIGIGTGEDWDYKPEFARALRSVSD
jgi:hypothetical protein